MSKNNYELGANDLGDREYNSFNETNNEYESVHHTSLGKAKGFENQRDDEPALLPGYIEIWPENFPSRGLFYAEGARFFIRAASVKEIRHFSTINEQDPFSVDEALNEIVKSCLMMRFPGRQASFKDLKEEDRIHIILSIKDLTFSKGENRMILGVTCKECNHDNEVEIKNHSFELNELNKTIMKYYNEETKCWNVQTKSSGVITLSPPSIGIMMETTKYIKRVQQEEGRKIDASFVKSLPYMIQDWRGLNEQKIKNLEIEFMQWDTIKYNTFNALTEMCKVGVKDQLVKECEKCGTEVRTNISFPGGIKSLFVVSDITGELL